MARLLACDMNSSKHVAAVAGSATWQQHESVSEGGIRHRKAYIMRENIMRGVMAYHKRSINIRRTDSALCSVTGDDTAAYRSTTLGICYREMPDISVA